MTERRRNPRRMSVLLDLLHLAVGIAVVVLSVIAFLNPEEHLVFFPLIFFLAAFLTLLNAFLGFRGAGRDQRKKIASVLAAAAGILLAAVGAVSAVVLL